jgi:tetratricopeptide (TPR) repeat protein
MDEKLRAALDCKAQGNAAFAASDFAKAAGKYKLVYFHIGTLGSRHSEHRALLDRAIGGDAGNDAFAKSLGSKRQSATDAVPEEVQTLMDECIATPKSNLALYNKNISVFEEALTRFYIALLYAPGNPKLPYRRGLALLGQGKTDEAREAFLAALRLAPDDPNTQQRLAEVEQAEQAQRAKQKAAMKAMFGGVGGA